MALLNLWWWSLIDSILGTGCHVSKMFDSFFFLVLFFAGVPWAGHCDGESHPGGAGPGPAPPAGRGHAGPGLHGDPLPRGGAPDCILLSA